MVRTKVYSGSVLLLDVVADIRPGVSVHRARPGVVYETPDGPFVQYGPPADSYEEIEIHIPNADQSVVDTVRAMARGDYGDVFRIEGPRDTYERVALIPGKSGVAVEVWPSVPGSLVARVVLRFVMV